MPRVLGSGCAPVLAALLIGAGAAAQDAIPIAAGDSLSGTLSAEVSGISYSLAPSPTALLLSASAKGFAPSLGLSWSSSVGGNFSGGFLGGQGNPLFIPPLSAGQSVGVQVSAQRFPAAGSFTLAAAAVEPQPVTGGEIAGTIPAGGLPAYFSFEVEPGKRVTLTVAGGEFDTRLQLFPPGAIFAGAADDNGGPGHDPEIYQAVTATGGRAYVEVAPAFAGEGGDFTLGLAMAEPPALTPDRPAIIRLGGARGSDAVTFAGGSARVMIESAGGDTEGAGVAIYQDGALLASDERLSAAKASVLRVETSSASPIYVVVTAAESFGEANRGQFAVSLVP